MDPHRQVCVGSAGKKRLPMDEFSMDSELLCWGSESSSEPLPREYS